MKTLILFFFAICAFAQQPVSITIVVTDGQGRATTARVTGAAAEAGLDSLTQWMATQQNCRNTQRQNGQQETCTPKYDNAAEVIKATAIQLLESIVDKFPSAATKALADEIAAKQAQLANARKTLFDAAKAEK